MGSIGFRAHGFHRVLGFRAWGLRRKRSLKGFRAHVPCRES